MNIAPVQRVLESIGVPYCLIGAHAMAARGYPRFTVDVDLLTTDPRVLERAVWNPLSATGATIDPRRGDADDPLAGVIHILLADGTDVDLVLGKWKWEAGVITRAELLTVMGSIIPVPLTSDLILLKLAAGGYLDLRDAAALLAIGDRTTIVGEVESKIGDVHPDVTAAWRELCQGP
jgi:hypothetical protein